MARITLDAETFKALASSTRLTVLRALDERRKTLTELAAGLELNKATVHEHLQLLTAAGLVRKRDDEGRKWIYYELTWTGQGILHPQETTTFNVLLGLGALAATGSFVMLGRTVGWWLEGKAAEHAADGDADAPAPAPSAPEAQRSYDQGQAAGSGADSSQLAVPPSAAEDGAAADAGGDALGEDGWITIALLAVSLLFTVLAAFIRRKLRPKPGAPPAENVP